MKELLIMGCLLWELWSNRHTKHSVLQCAKWHAINYIHSNQSSNQLNSSVICFCFALWQFSHSAYLAWFAGFFECTLFLPYFCLCCLFRMDGSYVSIAERDTYLRFLRFGQVSFPELICQRFRWFLFHYRLLQREDKRGAFEFRDWKNYLWQESGSVCSLSRKYHVSLAFFLEPSPLVAVLSDQAVDCLIGWFMQCSTDWLIDQVNNPSIDRSIDWLLDFKHFLQGSLQCKGIAKTDQQAQSKPWTLEDWSQRVRHELFQISA